MTTNDATVAASLKREYKQKKAIGKVLLQRWMNDRLGNPGREWTAAECASEVGMVVRMSASPQWDKLAIRCYYWFETGELTEQGWILAREMNRDGHIRRQKLLRSANTKKRQSASLAAELLATADPSFRCHLRGEAFYQSEEWQALRYAILKKWGATCHACGASAETGSQIHVDHILPRSLFPELALDQRNMQVLCRACNLAKSNTDTTLWRRQEVEE